MKKINSNAQTLTMTQVHENFMAEQETKSYIALELQQQLRQRLSAWGQTRGFKFHMAVLSLVKGAYDDVKRDVQRGRITQPEANEIVDKFYEYHVITPYLATWYKEKFEI